MSDDKKTFKVQGTVQCRYNITVEAEDEDEAKQAALDELPEQDMEDAVGSVVDVKHATEIEE